MIDSEAFTEQAEYLPTESFAKWSIQHHDEASIIKRLTQGGAKLITGPRGCGKTTLMLKAYARLIESDKDAALPVYVNFKSSLKLEPLYRNNPNAAYWFNQWLLLKVLKGLCNTAENMGFPLPPNLVSLAQTGNSIGMLELGKIESIESDTLTISTLRKIIDGCLISAGRKRCVLLLDDAGHAFSSDQQHDFFEFFREVKSKSVAPKAAIYPGVTSFSSSFHVGHDAEEIDVWFRPSDPDYLEFMHSLLRSRFGDSVYDQLAAQEHILNIICFAAYGIPRALLNMISPILGDDEESSKTKAALDLKSALKVIKTNYDTTFKIYDSLKYKLPMYRNFVDTGTKFFERCIAIVKDFNRGDAISRQSSTIAIRRPLSSELTKVVGFFQYAGLLSPAGVSSRGDKGVYELYELHYSAIIDRNVFFSSRGVNPKNYSMAFVSRPNHHYPRFTEKSLLDVADYSEAFSLALPPCEVCGTPRFSDEAKFCMNCGAKLKDASIFENIVQQDISKLPITESRAQNIKSNSRIRTIKDILMDEDNKELRSVKMVGPVWVKRIRSYAEEFIA